MSKSNTPQPFSSLRNHFLIAMPSLSESVFSHTITYLCDHSEDGAMGVVINQPLGVELDEVFSQLDCTNPHSFFNDTPVLCGGPVQPERGFILHTPEQEWDSSLAVSPDITLTASRDIIAAMANNQGPAKFLVALGYAGWGGGQLEEEIANNCWLTLPADPALIFDTPLEQRWSRASQRLGIDLNLISTSVGHA